MLFSTRCVCFHRWPLLIFSLFATAPLLPQNLQLGNISGSFQTDVQAYFEDTLIGAQGVNERLLSNSFLQLTYQQGRFSAGMRYEAYLNPLLGFDQRFQGQGIAYRFAQYQSEKIDITVGNFYEQFGNGLIFRAYQEWMLGVDNSIDGVRVIARPYKGIYLKGLIGRQRKFYTHSEGLMRGADAEIQFHHWSKIMQEKRIRLTLGGSVMSKYEKDNDPVLRLPENVIASAGRASLGVGGFSLDLEYAHKINDPFNGNEFVYNSGNAFYLNAAYAHKGLGITFNAKRVDNMDFRSERVVSFQELALNFIPPSTKQHTYRLPTLYPYATQFNGEAGIQASLIYGIPKETALGGKYGTQVYLNYSRVSGLDTTFTEPGFKYESSFFGNADLLYFQDFNVEISKKWSRTLKGAFTYIYLNYNKDIIEFGSPNAGFGLIRTHIVVLEASHRLKKSRNLRWELQHMYTRQDFGSWALALLEYSVSPHWFFTLMDEYNYKSFSSSEFVGEARPHFYTANVAYVLGAHRVALGAGRQRAGLLCVGGICRVVPASNGITLSINSSF